MFFLSLCLLHFFPHLCIVRGEKINRWKILLKKSCQKRRIVLSCGLDVEARGEGTSGVHTVRLLPITERVYIRTVEAMVFPVVMYECENWTIKKAEH